MCIKCFNLVSHDLYRINLISLHLSVLYKMFIPAKQRWSSNLGGINFITLKLCSFINGRNAEFALTTLLTFLFFSTKCYETYTKCLLPPNTNWDQVCLLLCWIGSIFTHRASVILKLQGLIWVKTKPLKLLLLSYFGDNIVTFLKSKWTTIQTYK